MTHVYHILLNDPITVSMETAPLDKQTEYLQKKIEFLYI